MISDEDLVRAYSGAKPDQKVYVNADHVKRLRAVVNAALLESDKQYAVFFPGVSKTEPHRIPPIEENHSRAWCENWIKEAETTGFLSGVFVIKYQTVGGWVLDTQTMGE